MDPARDDRLTAGLRFERHRGAPGTARCSRNYTRELLRANTDSMALSTLARLA
jgi:hypothetical protein